MGRVLHGIVARAVGNAKDGLRLGPGDPVQVVPGADKVDWEVELGVVIAYFFPGLGKLLGWVLLSSSKTGLLNQGLRQLPFFSELEKGPFDVYSYPGIIFVSVIGFSAFFVVFLLPAFRAMDASLEESARMSGASEKQALWLITVPLLRELLNA